MGHNNILYGAIEEVSVSAAYRHYAQAKLHNQDAIARLSCMAGEAPLRADMFHVTSDENTYRSRLFQFGATFSAVVPDLDEWLTQFEGLLNELYWSHATVTWIPDMGASRLIAWRSRLWQSRTSDVLPGVDERQHAWARHETSPPGL